MTFQRILTAGILIPIVVLAVLRGPTWLIAILVALVILLALREFFDLAARAGFPGYARYTSLCVGIFLAEVCLYLWGPPHGRFEDLFSWLQRFLPSPSLLLGMFMFGVAILTILSRAPLAQTFSSLGTSCAALLFVVFPLICLIPLHSSYAFGPLLLFFLLVLIWVGDTFAYFVGRWFGRRPMAPQLSPHKTWEGAVANLAGSFLVAAAFSRWTDIRFMVLAPAAVLGNIAGQIGDLLESAYKRAAGAKDSGNLLPGHGGILDRIDSLIFAAPVVWYYFSVIVQRHP